MRGLGRPSGERAGCEPARSLGFWFGAACLVACAASTAAPAGDLPVGELPDGSPVDGSTAAHPSDAASPADGGPWDADADTVDRCPDGFPRGVAGDVRQVAKLTPAPEGVAACENGDVFVSLPDTAQILRVPLDGGDPEVWTTLTGHHPLGMTCSENVLWVVDFGSKNASVFRVAAKDDPGTPMPNIDGGAFGEMNGVAVVKGVGIYATDKTQLPPGRIVRFQEATAGQEQASAVASGLAFPNDIKFDPTTNSLDVSFTLSTQVRTYPIAADGSLGASTVAWTGGGVLDAIDGIARDENKSLYVVHYLQGYVGRTTDKAKIASLKNPKSLAFRGGTLLITGEEGLYAAPLGICGIR